MAFVRQLTRSTTAALLKGAVRPLISRAHFSDSKATLLIDIPQLKESKEMLIDGGEQILKGVNKKARAVGMMGHLFGTNHDPEKMEAQRKIVRDASQQVDDGIKTMIDGAHTMAQASYDVGFYHGKESILRFLEGHESSPKFGR